MTDDRDEYTPDAEQLRGFGRVPYSVRNALGPSVALPGIHGLTIQIVRTPKIHQSNREGANSPYEVFAIIGSDLVALRSMHMSVTNLDGIVKRVVPLIEEWIGYEKSDLEK